MNFSLVRCPVCVVLCVLGFAASLAGVLPTRAGAQTQAPIGRTQGADNSETTVLFNGHAVVPGQYLARLKAKVPRDAQSISMMAARQPSTVGVERIEPLGTGRLATLRLTAQAAAQMMGRPAKTRQAKIEADVADLMATGLYDYVEPDYIQYATAVPSDTAFADGTLWGLRNTGQNGGASGADINAVAAWGVTTGSAAVVVGVIDTGIRYTHQDLAAQMWSNPGEIPGDGIDNDNNGYVDDIHGINAITGTGDPMDDHNHGTHCAGTIGASANDAGPIVGVAWNVRLMGLKFLNSGGSGDTSHAIKCIEYALSKGVRILSNSWGGGGPSQALEDAIKAARDQGCLFLAAAGNAGADADRTDFYPACYKLDNIVSIGALDRRDNLAAFTNTGLSTVDLAAPGVDVYSSIASDDRAYASFSGTSMATPHVAGVAALVLAQYPGISMAALRQRLIASTREVAAWRGYSWSGGAVDAYRALTITEDGSLDVRSSAAILPLRSGSQESLFLTVTDLVPVLGASVTGTLAGDPMTFLDDGAAPDRVASDGVYSAWATVPTGLMETTLTVAITAAGKVPYAGTFTYPVIVGPVNDDFAAAIAVPFGTTTVTGTNIGAGEESGEPRHGGSGAGRSVWWTWTAPSSGVAVIGTAGTEFFPVVGVYTGAAVSSLTSVGSNLGGSGIFPQSATFLTLAGTTYRIAVDCTGRTQGNIVLSFPRAVVPLPTNDNFTGATPLHGMNGSATGTNVTATREPGEPIHAGTPGAGSVWWSWTAPSSGAYLWSTSGSSFDTLLAVYTGDTVAALTEVASNDESNFGSTSELTFAAVAGTTYRIAVDGRYGSRGVVEMAFAAVAAPENDNFADATVLLGATGSIIGTNRFATGEQGEPIHINSNATASSVWYSWTAPTTGYEQFDTDGSNFDTALAVYTGVAVGTLTSVASDDNNGEGTCSRVLVSTTAGTTYRIAIGDANYNRIGGAIVLNRKEVLAPSIVAQPVSATGVLGGTAEFSVTATGTDLLYQWYHNGVAVPGATVPTLTLANLQREHGGTYQVVVHNFAASAASALVSLTGANPPPVVQPAVAAVTAVSGSSAQITVTAGGVGGLTYQWRRFGVAISGATGPVLTLSSATMADAGLYDVVVYDGLSQSVSSATRLIVSPVGGYPTTLRLDTSFAPLIENAWASIEDASVAASGEVFVVGQFSTIAGQRRHGVAKFDAALALDSTFAPVVVGSVYAVLAQPDGKVVIGGSFTTVNGLACGGIVRLNADGSVDPSFVTGTGVGGNTIWALARQADGKLIVGGNFYSFNGTPCSNIARLNADGSVDSAFSTATGPNSTVGTLVLQPDGKVMIGGWFSQVAGMTCGNIARLNGDGSLDTSFAPASGFNGTVESLALQADGKVVVGGNFTTFNGSTCNRIARLETTGALDTSFVTGTGLSSNTRAVAVLSDGRIAVSSWWSQYNGSNYGYLFVLNSAGVLDSAYASGSQPQGPAYVLVPRTGGLLVAGYFSNAGGSECSGLAAYSGTGGVTARSAAGFRQLGSVSTVVPVTGGKWVVGGYFGFVNGVARSNLARLNADGTLDPAFGSSSGPNSTVLALAVQGDGKIVAGGWFSMSHNVQRNSIARINSDGTLDTAFNPGTGFSGGVTALALQADGKLLAGGGFTSFGGVSRNRIARLSADGSLDVTFAPGLGFNSEPRSILVGTDGRVVLGGYFTTFDDAAANYLVGLLPTGARDAAFITGSGFSGSVESLAPCSDGSMMAAGSFWSYAGTNRGPVVRLRLGGSLDETFAIGSGPNSTPLRSLIPHTDGRTLVGGWFTSFSGVDKRYFARLAASGALDTAFAAFDLTVPGEKAQYMDDGGLLIVDAQADRNGVAVRGLVRLKPDVSPVAAITSAPVSQIAGAGAATEFSVTATGEALEYQWYKDGVAIAGATGSTLTITSVGPMDIGAYTVRVWNRWSSVTSAAATLSGTDPAPTITTQPGVVTAVSGTSATFTVAANGASTLGYQWRKRGVNISGATASTLTLPAVEMADAGFYDVIVYNGLTSLTSQAGRLLVSPVGGYPTTLRLDTSFAPLFENSWASIEDASVAASGEVFVVGQFSTIAGQRRHGVAKFDAALALDPGFAPVVDGSVNAVLAQPDGKVVIGGSFTTVNGLACGGIVRLNADGSVDPSFATGTGVGGNTIWALARQLDGKLIVGGNFYTFNGAACSNIVRLNVDGSRDTAFAASGGSSGTVGTLVLQPDGKVMIGGLFSQVAGLARGSVARLNGDGSLDTSFAPGSGFNGTVESLALQADGKVVAGGNFTTFNGSTCNRIARLETTGALDPTFVTGTGLSSSARAVAVLSDGRIAVSSWSSQYNGSNNAYLFVLNSAGFLDSTYASVSQPNGPAYVLVPRSGGRLLAGGYFSNVGGTECSGLVAYTTAGAVAARSAAGFRQLGSVAAMAPAAGGKLIVGGSFSHVDGAPRSNIARLNADGTLDTGLGTVGGPSGGLYALAVQGDGKIVAGGWFSMSHNVQRNYIARINSDGTLDTTFTPGSGFNSGVQSLAVLPDGRIAAAGSFSSFNGVARNNLALLGSTGALDLGFNPGTGFNGSPQALVAQPDGRLVASGYFTSFNGVARNRLARINLDGTLDATFDPGTGLDGNGASALAFSVDGLLVASGNFFSYNGVSRSGVVRIGAGGALDTTFNPGTGTGGGSNAVLLEINGRAVVGGFFTSYNGTARKYLARAQVNGALDTSFTAYDLVMGGSGGIQYTDDGRLFVAGARATRAGVTQAVLVRLKPDVAPMVAITAQPVNRTAEPGDTVEFSVTATGEGTLTYQWYKDGVAIAGATGSSLTLAGVQIRDVASYTVAVTNAYGTVSSAPATLTGASPVPVITLQPPLHLTTTAGSALSLAVAAMGPGEITYQWRKESSAIPGATGANFALPTATMSDAGTYDVVVAIGFSQVISQPVTVDIAPPSYGTTFRLDPTFTPLFERPGSGISTLAVDNLGRSYITGSFTTLDGQRRDGFARLNAAESLDAGFNPTINGTVSSVLPLGASGWMLIGGSFTEVNGVARQGLARLSADGVVVDSAFNLELSAAWIGRMVQQPDGKLLMVGNFSGYAHGQLVRFNADGTLDPTWNPIGTSVAWPNAMAVQADGKIVVGTSSYNGTTLNNIARLNVDGTLDATFVTGAGFNSSVSDAVIQPDGKIVVAGGFSTYNGATCNNLVRLNTDGTLDATFSAGTGVSWVAALLLQPDGKLVLGGSFNTYNGVACTNLIRVSATGALDATFAAGYLPNEYVSTLGYDALHGQVVVGGTFTAVGARPTSGLARYNLDGSLANAVASGSRVGAMVYAAVPAPGSDWVVAGDFTHINGVVCSRIARLHSDGSVDAGFAVGTGFDNTVYALARTGDGKVLAGGAFTSFNGTARNGILRLTPTGTNDGTFTIGSGFGESVVRYLVVMRDGRIVVAGDFASFNGSTAGGLIRLQRDGTRDASFSGWSTYSFSPISLGVDAAGRILTSSWGMYSALGNASGVRLNVDGTLESVLSSWGLPSIFDNSPAAYAFQPDGKLIVGGYFSRYGSTQRMHLARFNIDGTLDMGFGSANNDTGYPLSLNLLPDGRLLAGGYLSADGFGRLANRYRADGTLDPTFHSFDLLQYGGSGVSTPVSYTDDGRILVPGVSGQRGIVRQYGLVMLRPEASPAPVIVAGPTGETIAIGATADLTVVAAGTAPLNYQWFRGESGETAQIIAGATAATYTTPALTAWSRYWVRVTNPYGVADSPMALVRVTGGTMKLADWTAQDGTPADQRGALDSPAGDGVSNLMKFALGVPPMDDAKAYLPTPVVRQLSGQPRGIGLLFAKNSGAQGLALALETSSDLKTWLVVESVEESFGVNPDGTVLVRLWEVNPPNVPRRFARLKVDVAP